MAWSKLDKNILLPVGCLCLLGLYFIATSSYLEAYSTTGDMWFYLKKQIFWIFLGGATMFLSSKISTKTIQNYANILFLLSILSLLLVLIPGLGNQANGAQRWLNAFGLNLQPLEFAKLATIFYFAKVFSKTKNISILQVSIALSLPLTLILLQPNMSGASIIGAITLFLYYVSGQPIKQLFIFIFISVFLALILILASPYRRQRLASMTSPSYHSKQIQLALSSGGFLGTGLGNSQQKYKFIPQLSKDSIGATIVEETGLLGLLFLSLGYLYLTKSIFAKVSPGNTYSNLINLGIGFTISLQAAINLMSLTGVIPLTGVTLPFVSYGGSSIVSLFFAVGLVLRKS